MPTRRGGDRRSIGAPVEGRPRSSPRRPGCATGRLIGILLYTFARVGAATAMRVGDYFTRWASVGWVRLHEKGGRHHEMPCHHALQEWLDAYLATAGIEVDTRGPLFRTAAGRTGGLTAAAMTQPDVYRMIGRRAEAAGVATRIGCHSWRATGHHRLPGNGGLLEHAQAMAGHASARTTKLYDRRGEQISLDEVERITL